MLEVIRAGLRLVVSDASVCGGVVTARQNPVSQAIHSFFINALTQQPTQKWWENWNDQFPTDIQNLIHQVKSTVTATRESKRVKVEKPAESKSLNTSERIVSMLKQFSETEIGLYLKSLEDKEERSGCGVE